MVGRADTVVGSKVGTVGRIGGIVGNIVGSICGTVGSGKFVGTDEGIVMTVGSGRPGCEILTGVFRNLVAGKAVGVESTRGVVAKVPMLVRAEVLVLVVKAVPVLVGVCGSKVGVGARECALSVVAGTGEEKFNCEVGTGSRTLYVAGPSEMIWSRIFSSMGGIKKVCASWP